MRFEIVNKGDEEPQEEKPVKAWLKIMGDSLYLMVDNRCVINLTSKGTLSRVGGCSGVPGLRTGISGRITLTEDA